MHVKSGSADDWFMFSQNVV